MVGILLWLLLVPASLPILGESFQDALYEHQKGLSVVIGEKGLKKLYNISSENQVYRVTQLREINGFGKTAINKITELIGVRFAYQVNIDKCYREGKC